MKEPNWIITALFGAVLGFIPEIFKIIKYLFLRFSENRIVGDWHVYELTKSDNIMRLTKGTCVIKNYICISILILINKNVVISIGNHLLQQRIFVY